MFSFLKIFKSKVVPQTGRLLGFSKAEISTLKKHSDYELRIAFSVMQIAIFILRLDFLSYIKGNFYITYMDSIKSKFLEV